MIQLSSRSTNQDRLAQLRSQGEDSEVLLARLDLLESEGLRKDLAKMSRVTRVFPEVLPTQASLRWSTKKPNLVGFKREFWTKHPGIIYPDPGEYWIEWDWKAIEGRLFTAYSGDKEDLRLYVEGPDVHTFTCSKYLFEWAPQAEPSCSLADLNLPSDWQGNKDERRIRAKNFRYGPYQYGTGARAILGMPGIEVLGLNRDLLTHRAQRFLNARPKGVAWKAQVWEACQRDKMSRTFMGARRKLFGDPDTMAKDGMAHKISGSVANLMAWCLIAIMKEFPMASLILNKHDGAIVAFPYAGRAETNGNPLTMVGGSSHSARDTTTGHAEKPPAILAERAPERSSECERTMARLRELVEREWEVGQGVTMRFPAIWSVTHGQD